MLGRLQKKSNVVRQRWGSDLNVMASLMGFTLGTSDLHRISVCMLDHGSAFLLAMIVMMITVGVPLVAMELALGQFTNVGPTQCWQFAPVFGGIGFGAVLLLVFISSDCMNTITVALLYTYKSFYRNIPWAACNREWASDNCIDFLNKTSARECADNGWLVNHDGACYNDSVSPMKIKALWNISLAAENNIRQVLPAEEYYLREVLGVGKEGITLFNLGVIHLDMAICLLLNWIIVCLSLFWGLKSIVSVLYFSFICVVISLVAQLILSCTNDGAVEGINFMLQSGFYGITELEVWLQATDHVFFTLGICTGGLVCIASFTECRGDICLYSFLTAMANLLISIFSGFIAFAVFGSFAKQLGLPIREIPTREHIGFILYAHTLASVPGGAVWSVIFFFTMYLLGMMAVIMSIETIVSSICDQSLFVKKHRQIALISTCAVYFLLNLPMTTDGGSIITNIVYKSTFSFNLFLLSFLQCVALTWVYGIKNFLQDIQFMVGHTVCCCIEWRFVKYYFSFSWTILCPIFTAYSIYRSFMVDILSDSWVQGAVQLSIPILSLLPLLLIAVHAVYVRKGSCFQRLRAACRPSSDWGPANPKERNLWLSVQRPAPGCGDAVEKEYLGFNEHIMQQFPTQINSINLTREESHSVESQIDSNCFVSDYYESLPTYWFETPVLENESSTDPPEEDSVDAVDYQSTLQQSGEKVGSTPIITENSQMEVTFEEKAPTSSMSVHSRIMEKIMAVVAISLRPFYDAEPQESIEICSAFSNTSPMARGSSQAPIDCGDPTSSKPVH